MTPARRGGAAARFLLSLSLVGCALDRPNVPTGGVALDGDPSSCRAEKPLARGSGFDLGVSKLQVDLPASVDPPPAPVEAATREAYFAEVRPLIQARMVYPEEARRRRQSGRVALTFEVAKAGYVRCITLNRSSGVAVLDRAAIDLVLGAALPRIPESLGDRLSFSSSFHYRLDPLDTRFGP
jgi:TonB family protein